MYNYSLIVLKDTKSGSLLLTQVLDKMHEIKLSLAECLFAWCVQTPLGKDDTLALIRHLQSIDGTNPDGTLDHVTVCLLMALLYNIDVRMLDQEDTEGQIFVMVVERGGGGMGLGRETEFKFYFEMFV